MKEKKKGKCETCGTEFDYYPFMWQGKEALTPRWCNDCGLKTRAEEEVEKNLKKIKEEWELVCPPLYRDTEISRLPLQFQAIIANWNYGPRGLGFVDVPGVGKTRTAMMILKKQIELGWECAAISSTRFARLSADQFGDQDDERDSSRSVMSRIRTVNVLLFDDIGKGKFTERAELEFYDLLEHRTSFKLPTIWTANSSGKKLREAMSIERGESIMRRLMEFSDLV